MTAVIVDTGDNDLMNMVVSSAYQARDEYTSRVFDEKSKDIFEKKSPTVGDVAQFSKTTTNTQADFRNMLRTNIEAGTNFKDKFPEAHNAFVGIAKKVSANILV